MKQAAGWWHETISCWCVVGMQDTYLTYLLKDEETVKGPFGVCSVAG